VRDATGAPQSVALFGGTSELGIDIVEQLVANRTRTVVLVGRDTEGAEVHAARLRELGAEVEVVGFEATDIGSHAALADVRALGSAKDRARLIREHLLPPAGYMREVYARGSRAPLPWLYARRLAFGARAWWRSRRAGPPPAHRDNAGKPPRPPLP